MRMNGTTFNGTAKLIGLFAGAVGGLAGGFIYEVQQLCTKEDLKEAKDEITRRTASVKNESITITKTCQRELTVLMELFNLFIGQS